MSDQAMAEIEAAMRSMEALAKPSGKSRSAPAKRKAAPEKSKPSSNGKPVRPSKSSQPVARSKPARTSGSAKPKGPFHQRLVTFLVGTVVAVFLPFYLLLRLSVYLNQTYQVWPWLAIGGGDIDAAWERTGIPVAEALDAVLASRSRHAGTNRSTRGHFA